MNTDQSDIRGRSITPLNKAEEVSKKAFKDGMIAGSLTMIPTGGILYYLQHNSDKFRKVIGINSVHTNVTRAFS